MTLEEYWERTERIQQDLQHLQVDELLYLAKDRGLPVYQVDNPKAKTFGHYRVGKPERCLTETEELWVTAVRVLLFGKQMPSLIGTATARSLGDSVSAAVESGRESAARMGPAFASLL